MPTRPKKRPRSGERVSVNAGRSPPGAPGGTSSSPSSPVPASFLHPLPRCLSSPPHFWNCLAFWFLFVVVVGFFFVLFPVSAVLSATRTQTRTPQISQSSRPSGLDAPASPRCLASPSGRSLLIKKRCCRQPLHTLHSTLLFVCLFFYVFINHQLMPSILSRSFLSLIMDEFHPAL